MSTYIPIHHGIKKTGRLPVSVVVELRLDTYVFSDTKACFKVRFLKFKVLLKKLEINNTNERFKKWSITKQKSFLIVMSLSFVVSVHFNLHVSGVRYKTETDRVPIANEDYTSRRDCTEQYCYQVYFSFIS